MNTQTIINWTMALGLCAVICFPTAEPAAKQPKPQPAAEQPVGVKPSEMLEFCRAVYGPTVLMVTRDHGGLACETPAMRVASKAMP